MLLNDLLIGNIPFKFFLQFVSYTPSVLQDVILYSHVDVQFEIKIVLFNWFVILFALPIIMDKLMWAILVVIVW